MVNPLLEEKVLFQTPEKEGYGTMILAGTVIKTYKKCCTISARFVGETVIYDRIPYGNICLT